MESKNVSWQVHIICTTLLIKYWKSEDYQFQNNNFNRNNIYKSYNFLQLFFGIVLYLLTFWSILLIFIDTTNYFLYGFNEQYSFLDGWPNLWYFYGEAIILVLANIAFFFSTAFKIRQVKKETSMLKHNDSKRHSFEKDKQK